MAYNFKDFDAQFPDDAACLASPTKLLTEWGTRFANLWRVVVTCWPA